VRSAERERFAAAKTLARGSPGAVQQASSPFPHIGSPFMTRRIVARRSPIHGNGVFAVETLAKGEQVIQYKGKLLTNDEADDLYGDGGETGHTFLFTLNDEYIIDANQNGNGARWINHSCAPNCRALVEESPTGNLRKDKVVIETIRRIKPGEELTYDYGIVLEVPHTARLKKLWKCLCGSPKCTGTLLKSKTQPA
jgi:SET domain-containing protein